MKPKKPNAHYSAPPSNRLRQVNELLRSELASEFSRELELPADTVLTVTRVTTAPDLHTATVFISVLPDNQSGTVLTLVRKQMWHIMHAVGPRLVIKTIPKLTIVIDEAERRAARVDALLDSLDQNQ